MNDSVRILKPGDLRLLHQLLDVYEEAFGLTNFVRPQDDYLEQLLQQPNTIFLVACTTSTPVTLAGGLTAFILPSVYQPASEIYLYDLAVRPAWQRRGIGSLLLQELRAYGARLGVEEIYVQADRPDRHAIAFYEKHGGIPEDVIHFTFGRRSLGEGGPNP